MKLAGRDDVAGRLRASGLVPTHCIPAVSTILPMATRPTPVEPEARVAAICASVRRFAELGAASVLFITGPPGERELAEARRVVVEGMRAIGAAAAAAGIAVGLEPVHTSGTTHTWVHTIPDALALADEAGGDVGVFVDTWNLWDTPGFHDDVRAAGGRITGVHLADRREPTRGFYDRVFPGDGVVPFAPFLAALEEAGYDGWMDVEIFSEELWEVPAAELAARAVAAVARL